MTTRRAGAIAVLLACVTLASPASAQRPDSTAVGVRPRAADSVPGTSTPVVRQPRFLDAIPRSATPLASLVIPGLGQAVLRRDRFLAYVAVEGFVLLQYGKDAREGARERRRYRALAHDVSRASFGGDRPNGSWDYYEAMERYLESGQFSLSATAIVPETDTLTYNGSRWLLARRTFWANAFVEPPRNSEAYQRAVDLYLEKAVRPDFRWSWRNAQLQLDVYRRSIGRANDSARRARSAATLIAANHLLSAIDAFAVLRVEGGMDGAPRRLKVSIPVGH